MSDSKPYKVIEGEWGRVGIEGPDGTVYLRGYFSDRDRVARFVVDILNSEYKKWKTGEVSDE